MKTGESNNNKMQIDGAVLSPAMVELIKGWQSGNCKEDQIIYDYAESLDKVIDIVLDPDKIDRYTDKQRFELLIYIRELQHSLKVFNVF